MNFNNNFILVFLFLLLLSTSFKFYAGQYVGYIFSSFVYVLIFYLIKDNQNEKYTSLILFLLFIQIYNHLINLYLVAPIIISYFFIRKIIYQKISSLLSSSNVNILFNFNYFNGFHILKCQILILIFFLYLIENYHNILLAGFKQIFF